MRTRPALGVLVLACGVALAPPGATAAELAFARSGTLHEALFSVSLAGTRGIAAGAAGEIMESTDAGANWEQVAPTPTLMALLGSAVDGDQALVVGQMGTILRRSDDGRWQDSASNSEERLLAVDLDGSLAVAAGAFGTVLGSRDGGRSWTSIPPDWDELNDGTEPHIYAVRIWGDDRITIAGEFGLILRSDDGGASWTRQHLGERSIFALDLHDDGRGLAVGQNGKALATVDGGESWEPLALDTEANLFGVVFHDQVIHVTGMYEVMSSSNGGRSWTRPNQEYGIGWLSGLALIPGTATAIGVGSTGAIVRLEP